MANNLIALCLFLVGSLFFAELGAQDISNIRAFQEGNKAVIVYDLLSTDPNKEFYVKIFPSTDGGKTYGSMLNFVTGDANGIVKAGMGKMAVWDVMKESSSAKGEFVFRIDASSIGANGALPTHEGNNVKIQFLDVARTGNDVLIKAQLTNQNPTITTLIFANFLVVDDNDRICRDFSGDINKVVSIGLNEKKVVSFLVKNVDPSAKAFSQFDFSCSAFSLKLKNLAFLSSN